MLVFSYSYFPRQVLTKKAVDFIRYKLETEQLLPKADRGLLAKLKNKHLTKFFDCLVRSVPLSEFLIPSFNEICACVSRFRGVS